MQKIKNAIKGHRHGREDEYDNTTGATTYGDNTYGRETATGVTDTGLAGTTGVTGHHHSHVTDEVGGEGPVAVGVAEVPVVVTEEERMAHTHHHEHEHRHEEVCGQKTFTEVEDRPVVRERVERIVEQRPVEKQYVVETRFVGEREHGVAGAEIVDVKDRVVDVAAPGPACPANAGQVMNEVVGGMGTGVTGHHHTHGTDPVTGHHHTHGTDRVL